MSISQTDYAIALAASFYAGKPYVDTSFVLDADGSSSMVRHFTGHAPSYPDLSLAWSAEPFNMAVQADLALLRGGGLAGAGVEVATVFHLYLAVQRGLLSAADMAALAQPLGATAVLGQSAGPTYVSAADALVNAPGALVQLNLTGLAYLLDEKPDAMNAGGAGARAVAEPAPGTPLLPIGDVLGSSSASSAHLAQEVAAFYAVFLKRAPDQGGLQYFVAQMQSAGEVQGLSLLAATFAQAMDLAAIVAHRNPVDTIGMLCSALLDYSVDPGGLTYWSDRYTQGMTLTDVAAHLVYSALYSDLPGALASQVISAEAYPAAVARQNLLLNKAAVGLQYVAQFGTATNPGHLEDLGSDAAFNASKAVLAGVTDRAASVQDQITDLARIEINTADGSAAVTLIGTHLALAQSAAQLQSWY
jgi:hypothetical protein